MSSFELKIILLVSFIAGCVPILFIDPVHSPNVFLFVRMLGQPALIIAAFLLVEGFMHTKNKKKYFARFLVFGALAEFPFLNFSLTGLNRYLVFADEVFGKRVSLSSTYWQELEAAAGKYESVAMKELYLTTGRSAVCGMLSLAMGLLMLEAFDRIYKRFYKEKKAVYYILSTLCILVFLVMMTIIPFENHIKLIMLAAVFYLQRGNKANLAIMGVMMTILFYSETGLMVSSGALLGMLLVLYYSGKKYPAWLDEKIKDKPKTQKIIQYCFYIAYPLVYLAFWGISML